MKKRLFGIIVLGAVVLLAACGKQTKEDTAEGAAAEKKSNIVIGSVGGDAEIWKFIAASDLAEEAGLEIEVKVIDGGPLLNTATVEKQVDVNAFQSLGYLVSFNHDSPDEKLVPIATTYIEPMGIYSDKFKSIDEIEDGAIVAVADNPANTARGLRLLEASGLIKLAEDFDNGTGTPSDVIENPKNLEFKLIDDTTGPRILQDVGLALISNTVAFEGGLNVLEDAIFKEEVDDNTKSSINVLVTREDRQDDQELQKLAALFHSEEVKDYIKENFGGTKIDVQEDIRPLWEAVQ
ncbi:metal ABC transporter substrate-binding protein [Vagococcus sp. BWB3-3]|uniref:Metal ABC transporter substrate-binding protein n=1 Tax=Vagococcus allomyrinae TaxID=2794353 RepID=A0A940PAZ0_9ENTE|nr:MetQ/NlpA family ABC transporter substrate-binding protein [Vagococcus allomyrinae]MBP1040698.1 metal ABC transporter substrate-binding protein [Vagococcus allomyrinae]